MFDLEFYEKQHYEMTRTSFGDTDTLIKACATCGGAWPCAMGGAIAEIKRLREEVKVLEYSLDDPTVDME